MIFSGERFSELMKKRKISTLQFIEILSSNYGIDTTIDTIKTYRRKSGKNSTPSLDRLKAFSEILGVSIDELAGIDNTSNIKSVPITGTASCGVCDINVLQDLSLKALISADDWNKDLYAVIANGDSMANEIYDGDIAIIDPNIQLQSGDMVMYKIDDESAIKIFVNDRENNMYQFVPYNSNAHFKTRSIRLDDETLFDRLTMHKVVQVVSIKKNNRAARLKMIGR